MFNQPKPTPPQEWWVAPSPDADCYGIPPEFRLQLYHQNVIKDLDPRFTFVDRLDIPSRSLSLETGAISSASGADNQWVIERSLTAITAASRFAHLKCVCLDEPFLRGDEAHLTLEQSAEAVHRWIYTVKQQFPLLKIMLIEPFPFWTNLQLQTIWGLMEDSINSLHLDVDLYAVRNNNDYKVQLRKANSWCPSLGVILWGRDDVDAKQFQPTGRQLFKWYRDTFTDMWPRRLIVQSWRFGTLTKEVMDLLGYARNRIL